jgi:hypothetical protein
MTLMLTREYPITLIQGNTPVPKFKRVIRDKRRLSRLPALLGCEFEFDQRWHQAIIVDMSLNSVLLSAELRPPNESTVTLLLRSSELAQPLVLEGLVVRKGEGTPEVDDPSTFAVRFEDFPPELLKIVRSLILEQEGRSPRVI